MATEAQVVISVEADIVTARQVARQAAIEAGFGPMDQSRITTAVSELARNIVRYATGGRGDIVIRAIEGAGGTRGLEVTVKDQGPGIADIDRAMRQGFSTGKGLGLGLGGTKRLMDEMQVDSEVGVGTTIVVRKWAR